MVSIVFAASLYYMPHLHIIVIFQKLILMPFYNVVFTLYRILASLYSGTVCIWNYQTQVYGSVIIISAITSKRFFFWHLLLLESSS